MINTGLSPDILYICTEYSKYQIGIVSGSDQSELKEIFRRRGLDDWLNLDIHESPKCKEKSRLK